MGKILAPKAVLSGGLKFIYLYVILKILSPLNPIFISSKFSAIMGNPLQRS